MLPCIAELQLLPRPRILASVLQSRAGQRLCGKECCIWRRNGYVGPRSTRDTPTTRMQTGVATDQGPALLVIVASARPAVAVWWNDVQAYVKPTRPGTYAMCFRYAAMYRANPWKLTITCPKVGNKGGALLPERQWVPMVNAALFVPRERHRECRECCYSAETGIPCAQSGQ